MPREQVFLKNYYKSSAWNLSGAEKLLVKFNELKNEMKEAVNSFILLKVSRKCKM